MATVLDNAWIHDLELMLDDLPAMKPKEYPTCNGAVLTLNNYKKNLKKMNLERESFEPFNFSMIEVPNSDIFNTEDILHSSNHASSFFGPIEDYDFLSKEFKFPKFENVTEKIRFKIKLPEEKYYVSKFGVKLLSFVLEKIRTLFISGKHL